MTYPDYTDARPRCGLDYLPLAFGLGCLCVAAIIAVPLFFA